jgi:hypothetical protein
MLMLAMPGLVSAHGEAVLINLWIIIGAHVMVLIIMLAFFDYKIIFFYIIIVVISFFVYWYVEIIILGKQYINILFYIKGYLALLVFPLSSTYLFYRKTKRNRKIENQYAMQGRKLGNSRKIL